MSSRTTTKLLLAFGMVAAAQAASPEEVLVRMTRVDASRWGISARAVKSPHALVAIPASEVGRLPAGTVWYPNLSCRVAGPDDPLLPFQSQLTQHGAEEAWALQENADGVVVAVLDTGVAFENYAEESGGSYRLLTDLVGTHFQLGWDFVNDDAHPNDDNHHGSHMAAIVAETTNNGLGAAALARGATILPIKVIGANGSGQLDDVLEGIYHAADAGADVILMSFAFPAGVDPGPELTAALAYAHDRGALLVGAAGNDGIATVSYPAASPYCIAVGAAKSVAGNGRPTRARYSNFGTALDVIAFGGDEADRDGNLEPDAPLAQTFHAGRPLDEAYYYVGGTSSSAAVVAGTLALMLAAGLPPEDATSALLSSCDNLESTGFDPATGFGLVDPAAALAVAGAPEPDPIVVSQLHLEVGCGGHKVRIRVEAEVTHPITGAPLKRVRVYAHFRGLFSGMADDDETNGRGEATLRSSWLDLGCCTDPSSLIPGVSYDVSMDRAVKSRNRYDRHDLVPVEQLPGADVLIDHPIKDR